jgi:hypothetical protein
VCGTQRRRYEYAGPRADHERAEPEYRYLDWYPTTNTDYFLARSTFATWRTNIVFSLFIIFFFLFLDNLRPEARGPLKSGAWGGRPTCHFQTPPVVVRGGLVGFEALRFKPKVAGLIPDGAVGI